MAEYLFVKVDFQNGDNEAPRFIKGILDTIPQLATAASLGFTYVWAAAGWDEIKSNEMVDAVNSARNYFAGSEETNNARVYIDIETI